MIRALTLTSLYPNAVRPQHGVFVEHRVRRVAADPRVEGRVVAPVPWFPLRFGMFGEYAAFAAVPEREERHGLEVRHPRHLVIPKIGMRWAPALYARGVRKALRAAMPFDLIDAHYLYPDGVAAVRLGAELGVPVVVTARGSDVNLIPQASSAARRAIADAVQRAAAVVAVSAALRDALVALGAPSERVHVIRNGVDRERFALPAGPRRDGPPRVLSVGSLTPNKGHALAVDALRELPDAELLIAGRGPDRGALEARAAELGGRVRFAGSVDQTELARLYADADVLVLASAMEGLPNVVLEALACGTPVVATRVGGIQEVVTDANAGRLVDERTPAAIAAAVRAVLVEPPSRTTVRRATDAFDWSACADAVVQVFERCASGA